MKGPETPGVDPPRRQSFRKAPLGIHPALVGQLEGAPVHAESRFCHDIEHDPDRFFGVAMLRRHEPARIIGTARQDREIDRPDARADIAEDIARAIAGVARTLDRSEERLEGYEGSSTYSTRCSTGQQIKKKKNKR